ncbi:MAG: hypothetical protein K2X67_22315 [Burkholderiales bacterium]|nr:hypothetical protein [Burkholderiales bacterium]
MRIPRQMFGVLGLAVGLLALALTLLPPWIEDYTRPPPKPVARAVLDTIGSLKDRVVGAFSSETPPVPAPPVIEVVQTRSAFVALLAGFAALVFGIIAFVRREDARLTAVSIALGAGAIAAQHTLTAALIVGFAILTTWVLARHS